MDCKKKYSRLYLKIDEGVSIYRTEKSKIMLRRELQQYHANCTQHSAAFLNAFFELKFEGATILNTTNSIRAILGHKRISQYVRLDALYLLARLTLHLEPISENEKYRQHALDIANQNNWNPKKLRILVNWAFALIEAAEYQKASDKVRESNLVLTQISQSELKSQEVIQYRSRLLAHEAKLLISNNESLPAEVAADKTTKAIILYQDAIELVKESDHLRVNQQIELCEYIVKIYESLNYPSKLNSFIAHAELILSEAQRSLDSHNCEYCRGYYAEIFSRLLFVKGKNVVETSPIEAKSFWEVAVNHAEESLSIFEKVGHAEARLPKQTLLDIEIELKKIPRSIFLSHSSIDKPMVREINAVLKKLNYESWMDEDRLLAGDKLEMGLREAFSNSFAVVFFITSNFHDEQYLQTEIEYAILEKRRRNNGFQIISIILKDASNNIPQIPMLLEPYVYKTSDNMITLLKYILDSLPLVPGTPKYPQ